MAWLGSIVSSTSTSPRPERLQPTPEQRRASDPARSVWVNANAGTGKTRVLIDRVLRLLLAGAHPEAILCLTFTKAAAVEMTERVEARLARWATVDAATLEAELQDLEGEVPSERQLLLARSLFATVLDQPHGLPIMTIHALATSLLRRFPLEANVAPHFQTIDERTAAELLIEARQAVLTEGAAAPDTPLGRAFSGLVLLFNETGLTEAVREILDARTRITAALAQHGATREAQLEGLLAAMRHALNLRPGDTAAQLIERACRDGEHDAQALLPAANALLRGSVKTDQPRGQALLRWLAATPADRIRSWEAHCGCFLKKDLTAFSDSKLATKAIEPHHVRALLREQGRLVELCQRLKAVRIAERTEALLRVGVAALDIYERLKKRRAGLDYEDLIEKTCALLLAPGGTDWVLFKLDQRIEHILVDEAQDTSPKQASIVDLLIDEFFAGEGTRATARTVFVVGDEKQSIYSFQGADLANYRAWRERLRRRATDQLAEVQIDLSFRSVPAVLQCVDAIFAHADARAGIVTDDVSLQHLPFRRNDAGTVEVWPLIAPPTAEDDDEPWPLPDLPRFVETAPQRLAQAIAARIRTWLTEEELLESHGRPIRPGDILILLNRRGGLQELLIRALRRHGLPVAGADRLELTGHIAVQDLLALGRVSLLPEDDLSLAALLKSPLFGLDEERLFTLAEGRGPVSLLERLRAAAADEPTIYGGPYARLADWLRRADFTPPFEFFAGILNEADAEGRTGRERLLARLGPEAMEPIEAFLGQALAYEEGHPASMQGFMRWIEIGASELKRDPEQAGDAIRVLTVHGSKGLEAPIVILADAGPRRDPNPPRLVWDEASSLPFWRGSKDDRDDRTARLCASERTRSEDERRRLLYVALTRARDRLYVAGCAGKNGGGAGERSWHDHVVAGLASLADAVDLALGPPFDVPGRRFQRGVPRRAEPPVAAIPDRVVPLPAWAGRPLIEQQPERAVLTPSRLGQVDDGPGAPGEPHALAVGTLVHRLLELLPALRTEDRPPALDRFLAARARMLDPAARERIVGAVWRILHHPQLASLFTPSAKAEQAIAGSLDGVAVSGQIDRLAVTEHEVVAVDFKTSRAPPSVPEATPVGYLRQMAVYAALLQQAYPRHALRCGLVWTETGEVMWLGEAFLARFRPELGAP